MKETQEIEQWLQDSLADFRIDSKEKQELRLILGQLDIEQSHFVRNRAFDLAQQALPSGDKAGRSVLRWLRSIMRILDNSHSHRGGAAEVYFSPGEDCRRKLIELIQGAQHSLDICVFTISDDRISEAILAAQRRKIALRIITDDDKSFDRGSDIDRLRDRGVALRMDDEPSHMHNKFALIDRKILVNGSFNWTRSASDKNQENILVTDDPALVVPYMSQFELLWRQYGPKHADPEQIRTLIKTHKTPAN
ncbi:phospholipase D-like domain-containing protein [Aestuariirhabdus sp. Z084]|uniref:phospholipase D-like domain-containing protein n=1 Tax=Aestuariirhabdus haliotis TaxID=2918751 RepID=UPI00201B38FD|nr:phospholipase D-like domain-containing protein [Aestuariirhabdus haliotis]MCL6414035.1 phospholipase D-like domain-containing protein [Aestuariirhabdus haliotis]MCL6417968.1 phospholipase D-like domain-containing protein [Aestuariirhabdus haliotis]